jgi:hypothetical protein
LSAASAWEIATKQRLGKLNGVPEATTRFAELVAADGFAHLPVTYLHSLRAGGYDVAHRDPFDRMLAAQSELESLILVTCDPASPRAGGRRGVRQPHPVVSDLTRREEENCTTYGVLITSYKHTGKPVDRWRMFTLDINENIGVKQVHDGYCDRCRLSAANRSLRACSWLSEILGRASIRPSRCQ